MRVYDYYRCVFGVLATAVVLTGCGDAGRPPMGPPPASFSAMRAFAKPSVLIERPVLPDYCPGEPLPSSNNSTFHNIETPAVVRHLYVVNQGCGPVGHGSVMVYTPGQKKPLRVIGRHVEGPESLAFDRFGNLYVGNVDTITVYRRGTNNLIRTINLPPSVPFALAFDHKGYLYAALFSIQEKPGWVMVFAPSSSKPMLTITREIGSPSDVVFDRQDNVYVANAGGIFGHLYGSINVYAPRSRRLLRVIHDGFRIGKHDEQPFKLAFDSAGNLYSANINDVTVYAPGSSKVMRRIDHDILFPHAIRFSKAGDMYVANCTNSCSSGRGGVAIFAPGERKAKQIIKIGIRNPYDLTFDAAGRLYVANSLGFDLKKSYPGTVTVYNPGGSRPVETISNGLGLPSAVRFGP